MHMIPLSYAIIHHYIAPDFILMFDIYRVLTSFKLMKSDLISHTNYKFRQQLTGLTEMVGAILKQYQNKIRDLSLFYTDCYLAEYQELKR